MMGSEMTIIGEEPALHVTIDGSMKMSVVSSSQKNRLNVKNY